MSLAEHAVQQLDRLSAIILEDVGDGPTPGDLAAAAMAARDAVSQLAVPALSQLTALIAGVAESVVAGATEWNPALGGTLIAAVDDLRHLAARPFTDEDAEHLAHRASELHPYVKAAPVTNATPVVNPAPVIPSPSPVIPSPSSVIPSEARDLHLGVNSAREPHLGVNSARDDNASPQAPDDKIVPISQLFYADAGPHIVSGGTPKEAATKSDLLGRGIDALDNLTMKPIARQVTFGTMEVVAVETLLYRGRAALERAAAIREQIKSSGGVPSTATLEEMYDLIGLALKD